MSVTPKSDGAGSDAPQSNDAGLILCIDAAEARLMRRNGYKCITSPKLRNLLIGLLETGAGNAAQEAVNAIGRLSGVSDADAPDRWTVWEDEKVKRLAGAGESRAALAALPLIPSMLRDPEEPTLLGKLQLWACSGTTVLVGRDTFELVRVADTYAGYDLYRPSGRMDEPFTPAAGRVCLITADELRLLRLDGLDDVEVVLTYTDETQKMTGRVVTPWPTSIRALCGEYPELRVGQATFLVCGRQGYPFFIGLTRGMGFESTSNSDVNCSAALAWRIQTNSRPEAVSLRMVVWAGGDDVRQLVRYGGLSIFTGRNTRRKVQLRSLGLVRSGTVAGSPIYDLGRNYDTLTRWAIARKFNRPEVSMRNRNRCRVRCKKALPQYPGGTSMIQDTSPRRIKVTPSKERKAAVSLRNMLVGEAVGVTTVPLKTLMEGGVYFLNGRAKTDKQGEIVVDSKRCMIRAPRWKAENVVGMLVWLAAEPHVVMSGTDEGGDIFAVVRVANGTEDQQREAIGRWSEEAGRQFPHASGASSWVHGSTGHDSPTRVKIINHRNWRADALETAGFERYQTSGDYSKPFKIERRGVATLTQRARAYADKVPLADEGTRNQNLAGAMLNIQAMFGNRTLNDTLPYLLSKSTLPAKEKSRIVKRVLKGQRA